MSEHAQAMLVFGTTMFFLGLILGCLAGSVVGLILTAKVVEVDSVLPTGGGSGTDDDPTGNQVRNVSATADPAS